MYSTHDEITKNFDELQSDILGEKLTNNPKMKESKILSKTDHNISIIPIIDIQRSEVVDQIVNAWKFVVPEAKITDPNNIKSCLLQFI